MTSISGILHRPLSAAAAVAVATVSSDLSDKISYPIDADSFFAHAPSKGMVSNSAKELNLWVSRISFSNIFFVPRIQNPLCEVKYPASKSYCMLTPESLLSSFSWPLASSPALLTLHQYAKLARTYQSVNDTSARCSSSSEEGIYRWHLPKPSSYAASGNSDCFAIQSRTVVVLLGWLGAKQKHLKMYADWYTSRGFNVITFTLPLADMLSYKVKGKVEQNLDLLTKHLADCVAEEQEKNLIFHTFSNTGWIIYGVILKNFQKQDPSLVGKIKGCIVDSAPVAAPDPQVWASGFSAAFLKKQSIVTKGVMNMNDSNTEALTDNASTGEPKPTVGETALLAILEKFFGVVLNLPPVNERLTDVLDLLSSKQPKCPQLYVYSSSDRVIPVKSVESFIEGQRKAGHEVRAYNFVSSPHVDHFRNHPNLYTSLLTAFLDDYVFASCKDSS